MNSDFHSLKCLDTHSVMAPSSLKKMRGSRERVEGNYASSELIPSLGLLPNVDLGLTLLPGSQTQKENEVSSGFVTELKHDPAVGRDGRSQTASELSTYQSTVCKIGALDNERSDHSRSLRAWTRRKFERRDPNQSTKSVGSVSRAVVDVSDCSDVSMGIVGDGPENPIEVKGREASKTPASTFPSGNTSVLGSRKCEFLQDNGTSPEDSEPRAHASDTLSLIPKLVVSKEHNSDSRLSSVVSKRLVETQRFEEPPATIHVQHRPAITASRLFLQQRPQSPGAPSDLATRLRREVLYTKTRLPTSWTSHFPPEASKFWHSNRDAKAPATFTAATASLIPVAIHQHPSVADIASLATEQHQQSTILTSLVKGSAFIAETENEVENGSIEDLFNSTGAAHQRRPFRRRAISLPTLLQRHRKSAMESIQGYEHYALPTPPREQQAPSFQPPALTSPSGPALTTQTWDNMANGMSDALNPFPTLNTPMHQGGHTDHHAYSHFTQLDPFITPDDINFDSESTWQLDMPSGVDVSSPTHQPFLLNSSIPPAFRQANGHMMQLKEYYSHAEIHDLLDGWHECWELRSRRSDAIHQSQLVEEKSHSQEILNRNAQLDQQCRALKLNLQSVQQAQKRLMRNLHVHEQGELFQRFQILSHTLRVREQELVTLHQGNRKSQETNLRLASRMENLMAQPLPNAAMAKDLFQTFSPASLSAPSSKADDIERTAIKPNSMFLSTSRPLQALSNHGEEINTTQLQQNPSSSRGSSGEPGKQLTSGCINPQAITNATNYDTRTPPRSSIAQPLIVGGLSLTAHAQTNFGGSGYAGEHGHGGATEKVIVDLTDDSSRSSESDSAPGSHQGVAFADDQLETERSLEDHQSPAALRRDFLNKEYLWIDGYHPSRALHTNGVNFGPPSSKQALAAKAQELAKKTAKISAKKTKDVMNAVASLDDAKKEQMRKDHVEKKAAKQAASKENFQDSKKERGKLSNRKSVALISALQDQEQVRKSGKTQKRKQAARKGLTDVHPQVIQHSLDGRPLEERTDDQQSDSTQAGGQQPVAYRDPLFYEDLEVIHFPDAPLNENLDDEYPDGFLSDAQLEQMFGSESEANFRSEEDAAKEFERMLEAETRAELVDSEDGPNDIDIVATSTDIESRAYQTDLESEEE